MSEQHKYPQVVRMIRETPWAILPETLATIQELIAVRVTGHRLAPEEIQARIGDGPARVDMQVAGGVAILPIYGVITPKADLMTDMSGGTSVDRIQRSFREAMGSKDVKAVVLDVNSPGGLTDMIQELAGEIHQERGKKPILANANSTAASAAYWIAAQADELTVTPSGRVGSIGVFAAHQDMSKALEKAGIETTLISAGKHKVDGNPFEPLSDRAKATIQERIDGTYGAFVEDVARGRGVAVDAVQSGYGEGKVLQARAALREGMVDRVETLEATVARAATAVTSSEAGSQFATFFAEEFGFPADHVSVFSGKVTVEDGTLVSAAEALLVRANELADRVTSLAEVKRGSLTATKRDRLSACTEALRGVAAQLDGVLATTSPDNHRDLLIREHARFEMSRHAGGVR